METQAVTPKTHFEQIDELNGLLTIEITRGDMAGEVDKELKKIQKRTVINGFRAGKAPFGMIKKTYEMGVLAELIQRQAEDTLRNYISENKLEILGYPMYSRSTPSQLDVEKDDVFKFCFDLGLAPKFDLNFSKKDKVTLYQIQVDDNEINKDIEYAREKAGELTNVETSEANDVVYATLTELGEDGNALEGGITAAKASFVPEMITDEATRNAVIGIKAGDTVKVNILSLFNNNDTVIASTLNVSKEVVKDLSADFSLVVEEIKRKQPAEINEEFFTKVFGPDNIPANEEEYRARVKANLEAYYTNEALLWADHEISHLMDKNHPVQLPDEFLKRWLVSEKSDVYNESNIEEKYETEKNALVRRLILDKIAEQYEISPSNEQILQEANAFTAGMFRQYGLNLPFNDPYIQKYVADKMKDQEFVMQMHDRATFNLGYAKVRELITLEETPVSVEEYYAKVNEHNTAHHH